MSDATQETLKHIARVQDLCEVLLEATVNQVEKHDQSKLEEPEKSAFDEATTRLKSCVYGSDEYKKYLGELKPTLEHHYENNLHHPEHYKDGVDGMTLIDVLEMFCGKLLPNDIKMVVCRIV